MEKRRGRAWRKEGRREEDGGMRGGPWRRAGGQRTGRRSGRGLDEGVGRNGRGRTWREEKRGGALRKRRRKEEREES